MTATTQQFFREFVESVQGFNCDKMQNQQRHGKEEKQRLSISDKDKPNNNVSQLMKGGEQINTLF